MRHKNEIKIIGNCNLDADTTTSKGTLDSLTV